MRVAFTNFSSAAFVAPLSPGTFPPSVTSNDFRGAVARACLRGLQNLRSTGSIYKGEVRCEKKTEEVEPLCRSRSYESYASVSAADRIKRAREERIRTIDRLGKFYLSFVSSSCLPLPIVQRSFVKFKQWHVTFVTKTMEFARCSRWNVLIEPDCARNFENWCLIFRLIRFVAALVRRCTVEEIVKLKTPKRLGEKLAKVRSLSFSDLSN